MTTTENTPRIYVGTYAKYNNGSIEGKWLDLTDYSSKEEFYEACKELHADEEDPEFMFQDFENIPEGFISESWLADNYFDYLEAIEPLSEEEKEAFDIFINNYNYKLHEEDMVELTVNFTDSYKGKYEHNYGNTPFENFAEELAEEMGWISAMEKAGINASYFDVKAFANDLECSGEYWEKEGHVFMSI